MTDAQNQLPIRNKRFTDNKSAVISNSLL